MNSKQLKNILLSLALMGGIGFLGACSSGLSSDGGSPSNKKAGHSCILGKVACSALPARVCAVGRGVYQPYTCQSVGYNVGPCSKDSYGSIFAKSERNCAIIRRNRGG